MKRLDITAKSSAVGFVACVVLLAGCEEKAPTVDCAAKLAQTRDAYLNDKFDEAESLRNTVGSQCAEPAWESFPYVTPSRIDAHERYLSDIQSDFERRFRFERAEENGEQCTETTCPEHADQVSIAELKKKAPEEATELLVNARRVDVSDPDHLFELKNGDAGDTLHVMLSRLDERHQPAIDQYKKAIARGTSRLMARVSVRFAPDGEGIAVDTFDFLPRVDPPPRVAFPQAQECEALAKTAADLNTAFGESYQVDIGKCPELYFRSQVRCGSSALNPARYEACLAEPAKAPSDKPAAAKPAAEEPAAPQPEPPKPGPSSSAQ